MKEGALSKSKAQIEETLANGDDYGLGPFPPPMPLKMPMFMSFGVVASPSYLWQPCVNGSHCLLTSLKGVKDKVLPSCVSMYSVIFILLVLVHLAVHFPL